MSSTRLPGKVLADVHGEPMLTLMLRRLKHARNLGAIVVATSDGAEDDPIAATAAQAATRVYRGSRDDVLARLAGATAGHDGEVVRLTGDCPLIDPAVVDVAVELFRSTPGCDYAQNVEPRTCPDGLDVEVLSAEVLHRLDAEAREPDEREHVTLALRGRMQGIRTVTVPGDRNLADVRWTVDTADDLQFVRLVVERLGESRHSAGLGDILAAVRREPSLERHGGWRRA